MCKIPDIVAINSMEFSNFIKLIEKKLISCEQLLTSNKKQILKILFENSEHLSVANIVNISNISGDKGLDTTTTYRILSAFENFGIVDSILLDDNKKDMN